MPFKANVRSYGWYCQRCKERKPINKVWVASVSGSTRHNGWIGIVCSNCNTELIDCFVAKNYYPELKKQCMTCEDRFQCFTMSEAQVEKPFIKAKDHQVHPNIPVHNGNKAAGIKSYTGKIYDKLEPDEFCMFPYRDDCNDSRMRKNYTGDSYQRCIEMRYDAKNKKWYCRYGKSIR